MRNQPKMALKPWPLTQSQMILKNILLKPTPFSFQCTYCKTFRTYLRNNSNPLCTSFETPFTLLWQKNKFKFLYLSIIHPGPLPPFLHPHLTLGWDFVLTRRRAQNRKRNLHLIRAVLSYNTPKNEFRKLQHFVPLSLTFWRNSNSNVPAHFFICWDKTTLRSQLKLIFYNLPRNWAKSPSAERILDIFLVVFPLRGQDSWDSCQFWKWLKWMSAEINDQYFTNFSSEHAILLFE